MTEENRIVAAVSEERLCRLKMARGFPRASIAEVLRLSGTDPADLAGIAIASTHEFFCPRVVPWRGWFQGDRGAVSELFRGAAARLVRVVGRSRPFQATYYGLKRGLTAGRPRAIRRILDREFGYGGPVRFYDHHLCHAWSVYLTAGRDRCLVVTLDGGGDGLCARIFQGRDGRLTPLASIPAYDSIGNFYAYVTHLLGFKAHRDEGKVSGLAAHGSPVLREELLSMISREGGGLRNHRRVYYSSALAELRALLPGSYSKEDLAASMQSVLESEVTGLVAHWIEQTGEKHLALAGGVFANVRLNQELLGLPGVESIFVFPAMGDDGLSAGAALAAASDRAAASGRPLATLELPHAFLGPALDDGEIRAALEKAGVPIRKSKDEIGEMVRLLAGGEVVARCTGAMEYGPRALGHRSILYRPDDPTLSSWLNDALRRTEFMPFAPATTPGLAGRCFEGMAGGESTARFMTITFDCTPEFREKCPGVVHLDGTARPQIVQKETNPAFHALIHAFHERTGLPAVVNTSFNLHEEPIVLSPHDALRAWREVGILHLFLGGYVVPAHRARTPSEGSLMSREQRLEP